MGRKKTEKQTYNMRVLAKIAQKIDDLQLEHSRNLSVELTIVKENALYPFELFGDCISSLSKKNPRGAKKGQGSPTRPGS